MRKILKLNEQHIDKYTNITFKSYPSFKDFSKEGIRDYKDNLLHIMNNHKDVHFYGAFDNDKMVGVMRLFDFQMNLFGKIVQTSGLGFLGVDPIHKKQKVAFDLIKFYEKHYRAKNMPIGTLLPFKTDFYKLMGYGFGTKMNQYRIKTENISEYNQDMDLRYITTEEDFDNLFAFREKVASQTHGMTLKLSGEIEDLKSASPTQIIASHDNKGNMDGFLIFEFLNTKENNFNANNIYIHELVYDNPKSLRKLLGFLRRQEDQVQMVIFNTKDENFHYIFGNPENDSKTHVDFGNIETNTQSLGLMYKLLDIKSAFNQVSYRNYNNSNLDVRFIIEDDYKDNFEEVIINFENGFANMDSKKYDMTVNIKLSDFSSLFLGSTCVNSLYRLGLLKIDSISYLKQLDMTFYIPEKPIGNIDF